MARPNEIQKLKHGKLLTKANFPKFVETWNWLVTAFDAMTGDKQTNPHEGHIVLDRTNPDRPIIRWEGVLPQASGKAPGCFEIRRPSGNDPGGFDNPYYMVGANLYQCANAIDMGFDFTNCIIALVIITSSDSPQAFVRSFFDFTDLQNCAKDRSNAIHPLYIIGDGGVVLADLRNMPVFPQWEYKED